MFFAKLAAPNVWAPAAHWRAGPTLNRFSPMPSSRVGCKVSVLKAASRPLKRLSCSHIALSGLRMQYSHPQSHRESQLSFEHEILHSLEWQELHVVSVRYTSKTQHYSPPPSPFYHPYFHQHSSIPCCPSHERAIKNGLCLLLLFFSFSPSGSTRDQRSLLISGWKFQGIKGVNRLPTDTEATIGELIIDIDIGEHIDAVKCFLGGSHKTVCQMGILADSLKDSCAVITELESPRWSIYSVSR